MTTDDLKAAERRVFRTAVDHGLWDVFLASMVAMLAIAPLLSETMGDFWSSAVFLPVYAGVYLAIRLIREHVVVPRVGLVQFGSYRKNRLRRFTVVMLTFGVLPRNPACLPLRRSARSGVVDRRVAIPPRLRLPPRLPRRGWGLGRCDRRHRSDQVCPSHPEARPCR